MIAPVKGVEQEGLALYNPLTDNWGELIVVEGQPPAKFNENAGSSWDRVSGCSSIVFAMPSSKFRQA